MRPNRHAIKILPLAALGAALAASLSGCGGPTSGGTQTAPTPNSGPVIYGLNALAVISGSSTQGETSGLGYTDATGAVVGVITGATSYITDAGPGPLSVYQSSFPNTGTGSSPGVPLGFPLGGLFYNSSAGSALPTTFASAAVFRAYISTGAKNGAPVDLDTNSVILTSPEAPSLSQKLTFDPNFGTGQLGQGQYTTGNFTLPASMATTGLHTVSVSLADVAGNKSHTVFGFVEVAPSDVALYAQNIIADGQSGTPKGTAIAPGDNVTIDGGLGVTSAGTAAFYPAGYAPNTADAQGTVIFFVKPGTHTLVDTTQKITQTITIPASAAGTAVIQ